MSKVYTTRLTFTQLVEVFHACHLGFTYEGRLFTIIVEGEEVEMIHPHGVALPQFYHSLLGHDAEEFNKVVFNLYSGPDGYDSVQVCRTIRLSFLPQLQSESGRTCISCREGFVILSFPTTHHCTS